MRTLCFSLLLIFSFSAFATEKEIPKIDRSKILKDWKAECARVKGVRRTYSNGCVDGCHSQKHQVCTEAVEDGCDCGPSRCWHEGTCIDNPAWHFEQI